MYPQVFGKYVLERELARGGMARVCLATLRGARGFEKKLVVKQIRDELAQDDEFVRRFVEEAKTTVALSHPNIVPVYELGVERGTYFLAMELVDGVSITELLQDQRPSAPLTPEQGAYVGVEICRALDYAHRRMQVVHRDITPRNVMVDDEGQVKLIDFGIAARVRARGEVFGSPGHMPPEQMQGGALLGPETDLFAVAALLLEAWSARPPFRRKTLEDCEAAMRAPHPRPSDADPRLLPLDDAIAGALALDAPKRTSSADELGRALRKFLQGIDLGDVARSLGDRARAGREALLATSAAAATKTRRDLSRSAPAQVPGSAAQVRGSATAAAASAADGLILSVEEADVPVTRTFAERDELKTLSQPPGAPSTRKMEEVDEASRGDSVIETIATRPLETPLRARRHSTALFTRARVAVGVGLLAVAGMLAAKLRDERRSSAASDPGSALTSSRVSTSASGSTASPAPPSPALQLTGLTGAPGESGIGMPTAASQPSAASAASLSSAAPAASLPSAVPTAASQLATAPSLSQPSAVSAASQLSAAPTGSERRLARLGVPSRAPTTVVGGSAVVSGALRTARVAFFGDPGTSVTLDGLARGACPVKDLEVSAGVHHVRFVFEPTHEIRDERITVSAGERATWHADFTGTSPTIRVER